MRARVCGARTRGQLNSHFLGGAKLQLEMLSSNTAKYVKKEQRQVNKKFCELKRGNIGIVEKAQETRFGMSPKYIADTVG